MIKDEAKGIEEYSKLKLDMIDEKEEKESVTEDHVDIIGKIMEDEDEHRLKIEDMMKELRCK